MPILAARMLRIIISAEWEPSMRRVRRLVYVGTPERRPETLAASRANNRLEAP